MFGAKEKTVYGAVLDVRKDSIGVALVASSDDTDTPTVIFSIRKPVTPGNGEEAILKNTTAACKSALADVTQTGFRALAGYDTRATITEALLVVGAPWSATIPRNVQFEHDVPFTITKALLKDLETAADERDETELKAQGAGAALGYAIVDRALVDAKVNGYDVEDPVGTTGSVLDLTEVTSLIHIKLQESITGLLEDAFPKAHTTVTTHAFATYFVLGRSHPDIRSFCFISALPEMTEVGVVAKDALVRIVQIPYGTDTLLRSLCEGGNLPQEHIRAQICLRQDGVLDETAHAAVSTHFTHYVDAFAKGFKATAVAHPIPRSVYVFTDVSFKDILVAKTLEALTQVTGQTHAALDTAPFILKGSSDKSASVLSRFFHTLHQNGRF